MIACNQIANNQSQSKVLLTYGWVRSSYAALRNLSKHGVPVYVSDSNLTGMCQFSKFSLGFKKYTSHYQNETDFVTDVIRICDENQINLIFPSHNETDVLANNKSIIGNERGRMLPDSKHCFIFNNKALSYDLAESLGIPTPRRFLYKEVDELLILLNRLEVKKVVIKLLSGNSAKGVFYADSPEMAYTRVRQLITDFGLKPDRFPQVEEVVSGEGWGCSVLYWHGELVADFTHRRLREKISTGGTSTLRESAFHSGVREAALKIFNYIGWHGLAMCEFKVCPETGKFWFIEVNPRMWGSIPLAINAGVEFPYLAYLCATQGIKAAQAYQANKTVQLSYKGKWLLGDLLLVIKKILRFRIKSALNMLFEPVDGYDDFYWDDLPAFLGEILRYITNSVLNLSFNPTETGMLK